MAKIDLFLTCTALLSIGMFIIIKRKKSLRWRRRKWLVRPINQRRTEQGDFAHLFQELKEDPDLFFRYTRMRVPVFERLLIMLSPLLQKRSLKALSPEHRLAITLRYLATGDQVLSVALAYRVGESTARQVIQETCYVIVSVLEPIYLKPPTEADWKNIINGFLLEWNFPNCLGAIDGKHILMQCPPNSGSLFFNYKKTFSIVLLAVCDYKYRFTLVDIGSYGSNSDGGIFMDSNIYFALKNNTLNIPKGTANLPGSEIKMPSLFVADAAFGISKNIVNPYSQRHLTECKKIFNYRISRARRTIENAFGILVSRWRLFRKPICMNPDSVNTVVMSTICLHNFLKSQDDEQSAVFRTYCPPNFIDCETESGELIPGTWRTGIERNGLEDLPPANPRRAVQLAYEQRNALKDYFLTEEGAVPWQLEYVRRGFNT